MTWLNGKRTVYCRRCGDKGHNRRGCPTLSPEQKMIIKRNTRKRTCSYCHGEEHTRRKCNKLAADMANDVRLNKEYREKIAAFMLNNGIGIGTIVQHHDPSDRNKDNVYMVTAIHLDNLTHRDAQNYVIDGQFIGTEGAGYDRNFSMPPEAPGMSMYAWNMCKVVSPVSEEDVKSLITDEWLSGKSGLDKYYQKTR